MNWSHEWIHCGFVCLRVYVDCLSELMNLARSKGLICALMKDDHGNDWLEIRQFVASHSVPKHNYPIHLSRLIVDSSVRYFLEVLGHCVRQGSLIQDAGNGVDYSKAIAILRALDGGFTVCAGVDPDSFSRLSANEGEDTETKRQICYAEKLQLTLPDNRYRSSECSKWIDNRIGPRCSACLLKRSFKEELIPMDLRCTSSNNDHYWRVTVFFSTVKGFSAFDFWNSFWKSIKDFKNCCDFYSWIGLLIHLREFFENLLGSFRIPWDSYGILYIVRDSIGILWIFANQLLLNSCWKKFYLKEKKDFCRNSFKFSKRTHLQGFSVLPLIRFKDSWTIPGGSLGISIVD